MKKNQKGFTLIELLVVIAVVAILSSVVLAFLNSANKKSKATNIKSELSQLIKQSNIYVNDKGNYGPVTYNGISGNNLIFNCAQDGAYGGPNFPYGITNFSSSMFGTSDANGAQKLLNSIKSNSGYASGNPTVFCVVTSNNPGGNAPGTAWVISVRDPSNTKNYICADSSGKIKVEENPTTAGYNKNPNTSAFGIQYTAWGNVSCI